MKHGAILIWQIMLLLLVVPGAIRGATEWTICSLGWPPRFGRSLFVILDMLVYPPWAFCAGWLSFNAYAPDVFNRGGLIAASGGVAAIVITVAGLLLCIRQVQSEGLRKSGPLNPLGVFRDRVPGVRAIAARCDPQFIKVLIRHVRQKAYYAC